MGANDRTLSADRPATKDFDNRFGGIAALFIASVLAISPAPSSGQSRDADFDDLEILLPAINDALENARSGEAVPWFNPRTGNAGEIEVLRTFYKSDDLPCRDYQRTTEHPDKSVQSVEGTGCRTAPGFWSLDEGESRTVRAPERPTPPPVTAVEEAKAPPATPIPLPSKPEETLPESDKSVEKAAPTPEQDKLPPSEPVEIVAHLPEPAAE